MVCQSLSRARLRASSHGGLHAVVLQIIPFLSKSADAAIEGFEGFERFAAAFPDSFHAVQFSPRVLTPSLAEQHCTLCGYPVCIPRVTIPWPFRDHPVQIPAPPPSPPSAPLANPATPCFPAGKPAAPPVSPVSLFSCFPVFHPRHKRLVKKSLGRSAPAEHHPASQLPSQPATHPGRTQSNPILGCSFSALLKFSLIFILYIINYYTINDKLIYKE